MKKKLIFIAIFIALIMGFFFFYQWKQKQFLGLTKPQIEDIASIKTYSKLHRLAGDLFVAKNVASQKTLEKYFSFGNIYIIKKDTALVNCNIEALGGQCFQDIETQLCSGTNLQPRKFKNAINGKMILDTLFSNAKMIRSYNYNENYKYIIIYSWVKYSKACIDESSVRFLRCLENNPNYRIISLNTDMVSPDNN